MYPTRHAGTVIVVLGLLAGCGGGGGGDTDGRVTPTPITDARAVISDFVDENGQPAGSAVPAGVSDIPMSDRARYEGSVTGSVDGQDFSGDLSLDANFEDETITGTADEFVFEGDENVTGTLGGQGSINGDADGSLPQVTLTLEGDLTVENERRTTALALDGDFFADDGNATGAVAGTVEGNVGQDAVTDGLFAGTQ